MITDKEYITSKITHDQMVEYNKWLINEYPFLIPYNRLTEEIVDDYNCTWTELDAMPDGWRLAFGIEMCQEIKEALVRAQCLENYSIIQIKEKYGSLRWYDSGATEEVNNIVDKYERLSETICVRCGAPATYISRGWISPWCTNCKKVMEERIYDIFDPIEEVNGTK